MTNRKIPLLGEPGSQAQLLDATINASKNGIIITDSRQPDNPIIFCNKAFEEMTGYMREEIMGKNCRFLQGSDREQPQRTTIREALLKGEECNVELANYRKDGSWFWNEVLIRPLKDEHGSITHYIGIQKDTSERKNKEKAATNEKEQAQKLQKLKNEFISTASHELKTPITSLKATLQLLNRLIDKEPGIADKLVKLAQNTERHTAKLTHLVDDLLDSTKAEHGGLTLDKKIVNLGNVIQECCRHLQLDEKHKLCFVGDTSVQVYVDEHKINQVIDSLVNNAIKYAPASEKITIATEKLNTHAKVSVTDSGKGITEEDMPHLFKRYYQGNKGSQVSGLGLGLYIAAEIVAKHGGEIGVDSKPGKGSTFWFTLPRLG